MRQGAGESDEPRPIVETTLILFLFALASGADVSTLVPGVPTDPAPFLLPLLAVALFRWRPVLAILRREPLLLLLNVLPILSILWSESPVGSAKGACALVASTVLAVHLNATRSLRDTLWLAMLALAAMLLASIVAVAVDPATFVHAADAPHIEGAWRGVFGHKVRLGRNALLCVLVSATLLCSEGGRRRMAAAGILLLGLIAMCGARSATPWIALGASAGSCVLVTITRRTAKDGVVVAVCGLAVLVAALMPSRLIELAFRAIGRDPSLTGRVPLWEDVLPFVLERPWTGYGYRGFWVQGTAPYEALRSFVSWDPQGAHNALLEVALGLGLPGAALLLGVMLQQAARIPSFDFRSPERCFPFLFLSAMAVVESAHNAFLAPFNLSWILFLVVFFSCGSLAGRYAQPDGRKAATS